MVYGQMVNKSGVRVALVELVEIAGIQNAQTKNLVYIIELIDREYYKVPHGIILVKDILVKNDILCEWFYSPTVTPCFSILYNAS
jgi:hypothetical protein